MTGGHLSHLYPKARPRARAARWIKPVLQRLLWWRAKFFHPTHSRVAFTERVAGMELLILPGVFNPVPFLTSPLLVPAIDALGVKPDSRWLELGTGCGLAALHAARRGARVTAVDINTAAVACVRKNAARLRVEERVEVLEGDLFAPVGDARFDVVVFHPPYFPGEQTEWFGQAWRFGSLPQRFAEELGAHLAANGCALLMLSTNGECAAFLAALEENGFQFEIVLEHELYVELVVAYRVWKD